MIMAPSISCRKKWGSELTVTSQERGHAIIIDISIKTSKQQQAKKKIKLSWMLRSVEDSRWRKDVRKHLGFLSD